ncbi:MAG: aminotransferase class V-fold PLP-dependent enzyme [Candidatus Latescibacterota bacterium]
MAPSTSTCGRIRPSTFASLGVRPVINAGGTYTVWSGSRMVDVAVEAMVEATNGYVRIGELVEAIGRRLAEVTGAEWGYVTSSCAAAINQITAAAIAGGDPEKIVRLPDTTGMRDEIVQEACLRSGYEQCMRICGGRVVTVETEADLRACLGARTALVFIDGDAEARSRITPARMIAIAREHGVPSFVDAAAQPLKVPNRYLAMGADAVAYSGGKCLRGPQASGLVLGRKDLLQAAYLHASPHGSQGRAMKVGKEEAMALLAAVEAYLLGRDHEAEWRMWEGYLETIRQEVADLPSLRTERLLPGVANVTPYLAIDWDPEVLGAPGRVHAALLEGEPRILTGMRAQGLQINPYMLEDGEAQIVGRRLREVLGQRLVPTPAPPPAPPAVDICGDWRVDMRFVYGRATHSMRIAQQGAALSGAYRSQYEQGALSGQVTGDRVTLRGRYELAGTVQGDTMEGTAQVGQDWPATWTARREG